MLDFLVNNNVDFTGVYWKVKCYMLTLLSCKHYQTKEESVMSRAIQETMPARYYMRSLLVTSHFLLRTFTSTFFVCLLSTIVSVK